MRAPFLGGMRNGFWGSCSPKGNIAVKPNENGGTKTIVIAPFPHALSSEPDMRSRSRSYTVEFFGIDFCIEKNARPKIVYQQCYLIAKESTAAGLRSGLRSRS
jgi:hypothetical protein